jgi:ferric-dicitrate binding protein FerR (iron transport regulator)
MKISDYQQFELNFDCDEARELLLLYVLDRGDLSLDERWAIEKHLEDCGGCRDEYEQTKLVNDALVCNRDELVHDSAFKNSKHENEVRQMSEDEADFLQFQAKMHRAIARRKKAEKQKRWNQLRPVVKVVSAIAACMVVGFGLFFATNQLKDTQNNSSPVASVQQQNSVKIELISDNTIEVIPTGQTIATDDAFKILRINGNRQMVLNVGTELSIEPYNLGCVVKLDQGEIYTEVEHDGKSFMVETSHGRAVITGTTFNIKADHDKMDLAVVEGSVRFESEKGNVNVKGGYQSSIAGNMKPSTPVICDAVQIAQWAKGLKANEIIPVNQPDVYFSEMLDLPVAFIPYCDLEDINFDRWIDQRREWFEREFPWTKRLQTFLAEDGIEVDTIELLIESGDLWRFAWPEYSQQRILTDDREVIQAIANQYGFEVDKLSSSKLVQSDDFDNVKAFERWLDALDNEEYNLVFNSIHAVTFLINTRSLAWYAVDEDRIQIQDEQRVLGSLAEQVETASNCLESLKQLILADKKESVCSTVQYQECIIKVKSDISTIMKNEKELVGYDFVSE